MYKPDLSGIRAILGYYRRRFGLAPRWDVVRFLFCGGTVLLILGVSGVLGLLRLLSHASLFNPPYWINWVHLSVGAFALAVAILGNKKLQLTLALVPAVAATLIGIRGLAIAVYVAARDGVQQPIDLSDPLAHLGVGLSALWAVRNSRREDGSRSMFQRTT